MVLSPKWLKSLIWRMSLSLSKKKINREWKYNRMDETLELSAGRSGVWIPGRGKCSQRTVAVDARVKYPLYLSQGSPHLQTQLQDGSHFTFSYNSFSSFTFPAAPYRIFLLFLSWLPCHFYLWCHRTTNDMCNWETGASRHHGSPIDFPPYTPQLTILI